jgi:hypothetical protein
MLNVFVAVVFAVSMPIVLCMLGYALYLAIAIIRERAPGVHFTEFVMWRDQLTARGVELRRRFLLTLVAAGGLVGLIMILGEITGAPRSP